MPFELSPATPSTATDGYYATADDLRNVLGERNVAILSNLDNDSTTEQGFRVTAALAAADAEVNRRLKHAGITTPVPTTSTDFPALTEAAAKFAAWWLYTTRGMEDVELSSLIQNHFDRSNHLLNRLSMPGVIQSTRLSLQAQTAPTGIPR